MRKWNVYWMNGNFWAAPNRQAVLDADGVTLSEAKEMGIAKLTEAELQTQCEGEKITLGDLLEMAEELGAVTTICTGDR